MKRKILCSVTFFSLNCKQPSYLPWFLLSFCPFLLSSSPSSLFSNLYLSIQKKNSHFDLIGFHSCISAPYENIGNCLNGITFTSNITHGRQHLPTHQKHVGIVPSDAFPPPKPFVDISSQHLRMVSEALKPICTQTRSFLSFTLFNLISFFRKKNPICLEKIFAANMTKVESLLLTAVKQNSETNYTALLNRCMCAQNLT